MQRLNNFIFVLSGPSGAGKTTLIKRLLRDKKIDKILRKIRTYTTRKPRNKYEDYVFLTRRRFLGLKRKGYFLETQKVYGDWYGTPKDDFENNLSQGNVLLCIDIKGAKLIRRLYGKRAILIFIMPPEIKDLEERMKKRGRMPEDFELRLREAGREIADSCNFDYIIVNKDLKDALRRLKRIIFLRTSKG